ncbi:ABC transporter substrate-binding protein [Paenibacillus eucommiae]|uniref:Multiple sugar transport system substrate-binding protein n=1 Tax=Paenibacillus eucommiae TaxID=1355755 RepID=A0ABS4J0J3_9BACL|nr:extracellular solute-binding protein [Paenibacillus eucommiae]MBP1993328.1 multiple sugar transport system substrate-binding protein [Paenibacillus eucommiae]
MNTSQMNRKSLKISSLVFVILLLSFSVIAGCSSGSGKSKEDDKGQIKEIHFVAAQYNDETEPVLRKLVAGFEEENPGVKVKLEVVGWDMIEQKVNTMVTTHQTPDILNLHQFISFKEDDLLLPMDELISPELKEKFYESLYDVGVMDSKVYALPFGATIRALFYNKDLFEKAGVSEPPATWDELIQTSKKIKEATGIDGFGLPMTTFEGQAYFSYFIWGNGGAWKKDGEWVLNSPENVEAVEFLADLVHKHKITNPEPTAINRDELHKVFGAGKLGMMISPNYLTAILKSEAPDLNYDLGAIPVKEGIAPINLGVQDFMMVFKSVKHKEEVGKFLEYFYEDKNYEAFMVSQGFLPGTKTVGASMSEKDPQVKEFVEQLPLAKFYPLTDPKFAEMRLEVIHAVQKVLLKEATAQEALDEVQSKAIK